MTNGTNQLIWSCYIDDDTSTATSAVEAAERPGAKAMGVMPIVGDRSHCMYGPSWSAAKTFGPNPQAQDSLQGDNASNPSEQSYWAFQVFKTDASSSTIEIFVEIEYDVVWDELRTITAS